jgi:hypothetical protein
MTEHDSSVLPPTGSGKIEAYSIMTMRWHKVTRSAVRKLPHIYTKWQEIASASDAAAKASSSNSGDGKP